MHQKKKAVIYKTDKKVLIKVLLKVLRAQVDIAVTGGGSKLGIGSQC
jgi:hypothetical protein